MVTRRERKEKRLRIKRIPTSSFHVFVFVFLLSEVLTRNRWRAEIGKATFRESADRRFIQNVYGQETFSIVIYLGWELKLLSLAIQTNNRLEIYIRHYKSSNIILTGCCWHWGWWCWWRWSCGRFCFEKMKLKWGKKFWIKCCSECSISRSINSTSRFEGVILRLYGLNKILLSFFF